jgi:hypothetical protein
MEKTRIRGGDKHPGSATLVVGLWFLLSGVQEVFFLSGSALVLTGSGFDDVPFVDLTIYTSVKKSTELRKALFHKLLHSKLFA